MLGRHFHSFSEPLLPAYFVHSPGQALGEPPTEWVRERRALGQLTITLPPGHLVPSAGLVDFLQELPWFPEGLSRIVPA